MSRSDLSAETVLVEMVEGVFWEEFFGTSFARRFRLATGFS